MEQSGFSASSISSLLSFSLVFDSHDDGECGALFISSLYGKLEETLK